VLRAACPTYFLSEGDFSLALFRMQTRWIEFWTWRLKTRDIDTG
jgi:hypothetical protein